MALALNNLKRVDMPLNKETKPDIITPDHSEPGSNSNEGVLHTSQISRNKTSQSNAV